MPQFISAFEKITRAQRQASDLHDQVREFFTSTDEPSYRITAERDVDPRQWRGIFHVVKKPPNDWAIQLGEITYHLRSALDHLVFEASSPARDGSPRRGTEFTIFVDEPEFRKVVERRLGGLNPATRAFVERHQPFLYPDEPDEVATLWLLHQLANTDKHRLLNYAVVVHTLGSVRIMYQPGDTPLGTNHIAEQRVLVKTRLEDGAEFVAFRTPEPLPEDVKIDVYCDATPEIEFDDATPEATGVGVFEGIVSIGTLVGRIRNEFIKMNPGP